jgi:hypothetical protein
VLVVRTATTPRPRFSMRDCAWVDGIVTNVNANNSVLSIDFISQT